MNNNFLNINSYTEAVNLALQGNEDGFNYLYQKTYYDKYYIVLKYMKNEQDAQDVLQDAYVKAWGKLVELSDPEKFSSWMSRICATTALNALQKKSPMVFSDLENEDEEGNVDFYDVADDGVTIQPERAYTTQETQDMVRDLLDSLSDEQRFCILMYYIEGLNTREIAESLGCTESTVRSRLSYGRNALRKQCEELQKKGYQLYSVAPIPMLLYLLRTEAAAYGATGVASGSAVVAIGTAGMPASVGATGTAGMPVSVGAVGTSSAVEAGAAGTNMPANMVLIAGKTAKTISAKLVATMAVLAVALGVGIGGIAYAIHNANEKKNNNNSEETITTELSVTTDITAEANEDDTLPSTQDNTVIDDNTVDNQENSNDVLSIIYGQDLFSTFTANVVSTVDDGTYGDDPDGPKATIRYFDITDICTGYEMVGTLTIKNGISWDKYWENVNSAIENYEHQVIEEDKGTYIAYTNRYTGDSVSFSNLGKTYTITEYVLDDNGRGTCTLIDETGETIVIANDLALSAGSKYYSLGEDIVYENICLFVPYETECEDIINRICNEGAGNNDVEIEKYAIKLDENGVISEIRSYFKLGPYVED